MILYLLALVLPLSLLSGFRNSVFVKDVTRSLEGLSLPNSGKKPGIGLVLAHPDDESMFFTPTLAVLSQIRKSNKQFYPKLYLMYLSNGDAEGKGSVRSEEVMELCHKYNFLCSIVNDPELQDGPEVWDPEAGLNHINDFVLNFNLAVIFTFDDRGVSGHPNHIGTHRSVKLAKEKFEHLKVFYLDTWPLVLKYTSIFSLFLTLFKRNAVVSIRPWSVFENMRIHKSQMRFHIPLWSLFSSYCYINTYSTS